MTNENLGSAASQDGAEDHYLAYGRREFLWSLFLALASFVAVIRLSIAFRSNEQNAIILLFLIVPMSYVLSILEGLLAAVTKLRSYGDGDADNFIKNKILNRRSKRLASYIFGVSRTERFANFVSGRQILVMLLAASITLCVTALPISKGFPVFIRHAPGWLPDIINGAVDLTVAALIPCWFAQLLPQHLAIDKPFEFSRLLFGHELACLSVRIGDIGAGWPALLAEWAVQFFAFSEPENIGISPIRIFDHMVSELGYCIESREIHLKINKNECIVTDKAIFRFVGEPQSVIWFSLRLFKPATPKVTSVPEFPVHAELEPKIFNVEISDLPKTGAEAQAIWATKISLSPPLPRSRDRSLARGSISATYQSLPLDYKPSLEELLFVDISTPTQRLRLRLEIESPCWIMRPKAYVNRSVALLNFPEAEAAGAAKPEEFNLDGDSVWTLDIDYPPVGAQVMVPIDARCSQT